MQAEHTPRDSDPRVAGLLRNKYEDSRPAGFFIAVTAGDGETEARPLASGFSHIDGGFVIRLEERAQAALRRSGKVRLIVDDRFGRRVAEAGPFSIDEAHEGVAIDMAVGPEQDRPVARPFWQPFVALRHAYPREIGTLQEAGVRRWEAFAGADIDVLSHKLDLPSYRLEALRLHGEMNTTSPAFDDRAAKLLVEVGVRSRGDLAAYEPQALLRTIQRAADEGRIELGGFEPAHAGNWVALARGWDKAELFHDYGAEQISATERLILEALIALNPGFSDRAHLIEPHYWAQMQTIADMRSILTSAGVYDLSALRPFVVRGRTVIRPGYHFAVANRGVKLLDDAKLLHAIVAQGGGFAKVKASEIVDYGVHILPNPVTDAVILGPLVQFIDANSELVIGKDVTSLIIVTESVDYNVLHKIRYEEPDRSPPTPAPFPGRPDAPRNPANVTSAYRPGSEDRKGRDGLRGNDGMPGEEGFSTADPAPSLKLYVKATPNGLPDIDLNGRRGGRGQDGQDGGNGEDGAKGRESVGSFWLFCVTNVGHGGDAGDGGDGGDGGMGGQGGKAGGLEIYSPIENIAKILTRPGFFLGTTGGPGGEGGQGGSPGAGGAGGEAGHDTAGCDAHPEWHGQNGKFGAHGGLGALGPQGPNGGFSHVPITLDQWNAAFYFPYLLRLEPASGAPGAKVRAVGLNVTHFASLTFGPQPVTGAAFNVAANTIDFVVPDNAGGGLTPVILKLDQAGPTVPGLDYAMSNTLNFRVTPMIESLTPAAGVPGQTIKIKGKGFTQPGAQVLFGGKALAADASFFANEISFDLPAFEDIGLPAGPTTLQVQNPDGALSNTLMFELGLVYRVRMKAWRVFPAGIGAHGGGGGSIGTDREIGEIHNILVDNEHSPRNLWLNHSILLDLDIADAALPNPWGDDSVSYHDDPVPFVKAHPFTDGTVFFDPGAINFYFVKDIDDTRTTAYTLHEIDPTMGLITPPTIVFEDTASLSTNKAAIVASHEVGHAFGLRHICARTDDGEDISKTLFGRVCSGGVWSDSETTDREYLMYPELDWFNHNGVTVTNQEAVRARRAAVKLHGK